MSSSSPARQGPELSALALIDECTDYSERGYQQLPPPVQQRVSAMISAFRSKSVRGQTPEEIGDLIASLAELVPIQSKLFSELCESISSLCIDREFVQLEDEALETVFEIILKHLELKVLDPSPGLRALSTLLYGNTLRLVSFHNKILDIALSVASASDESHRRCCVLLGNLAAFSKKQLDHQIYIKAAKLLMNALATCTAPDLLSSALRALQLLVLDAPTEVLDPQALTHTISAIAFKQNPSPLKFESIMALKALANASKSAFYAQWSLLLTKSPSIFDLLKQNQRVAKASADFLTDIFRDTWKFLYIADNTARRTAFTTLAQQIGDIVDISFTRFLDVLSRESSDKLDPAVFNRVAKAFATFVRNCSFDGGRLKGGYVERIVAWCKSILPALPEEALIVLKSLLWTDIKFKPFADSFDYMFHTFVSYISHENQDFFKPAAFALCRMAYAYPAEIVARYDVLGAKMKEIGPVHSLPILLRLAENEITDMRIWMDILELYIPKSFEINHQKSIQRSLQCIGLTGPIFSQLPDNLQRFCLSTVLGSDLPEAAHAVGLLARSTAAETSAVFLTDALLKLMNMRPPELQALSNVLESYALRHRDSFEKDWIQPVMGCLSGEESPYMPRCIGFMFAFIEKDGKEADQLTTSLLESLKSSDPKVRWNTAAALSVALSFGATRDSIVKALVNALEEDRIAKVKIKSTDALLQIETRQQMGDVFHKLLSLTIQLLMIPAHFTNLALATQRKYDAAFRDSLISLFFKLLTWTTARDFASLEETLVANVDGIYELMSIEENAPWEHITRLYEAKFKSIPSETLMKFQDKAFPV